MIIGKVDYSFEDEVITKFCYDSKKNQIEVQFEGYYEDKNYVESTCSLFIEDWQDASSKLHGENNYDSLETHLGIFSMILYLENSSDNLHLSVNTVDDKYLELLFKQVKVRIERTI